MNKLDGRILRSLLLFALLAACVLPQAVGQRRRRGRGRAAAAAAARPRPPKFQLDCTLPTLTTDPLPIDRSCGNSGNSPANSSSAMQNQIKNRFCLPSAPDAAVDIDFAAFDALQREAEQRHIPFGRRRAPHRTDCQNSTETLPADRSVLADDFITDAHGQHLGEGTLVRLEAIVFEANHSNTFVNGFNGESVNCNQSSLGGNDIHVALVESAGVSNKCQSVTAEISPHHRNDTYNRFDTDPRDFLNGHTQHPGEDKVPGRPLPLKGARVRVTGQLFFDAAHAPCGNRCGSSPRRSIWEIHPVYSIEVFDTARNTFVPFEEWAQSH